MTSPDPGKIHMMPAIVGREPSGEGTWYHDVLSLSVTAASRREAIEPLLPSGFEVGTAPDFEPLVTVSYGRNRQIDWLAGGSYNILGVNVAATYRGERDEVAGSYCVILWEDRTEPILSGRELTGIPKVYAEITDLLPVLGEADGAIVQQGVMVRASLFGRPIAEMELSGLEPLDDAHRAELEKTINAGNWMGYKYIPKIGAPGADVEYATVFPSTQEIRHAEAGTGRVRFFPSTFASNPTQFQVINLLCELEPLEVRGAMLTQGRTCLYSGRARALR